MAASRLKGLTALLAIICVPGCETSKSANPLTASVAGPIPGVNITAPKALEPIAGSQVVADGTRVTLLIENAGSSGQRSLWLELDMATDGEFKQMVFQANRVELGPDGRTTFQLPSQLAAGNTYYWRVRAQDGANTGPYSEASSFQVVDPVVLGAPTPLEPNGNITTTQPVFKMKNGTISGTTGVIYRLEISRSADPGSIVAVVTTTPDGSGTTSASIGDLGYGQTLYWRAYATDQVHQSPFSSYLSFKTPSAPSAPSPTNPSVPLGPGTRTPNPSPGQRLPLPSYGASVVRQVATAYPAALRNSCQDHGGSWEFMDRVVDTLRTYDTRWGYNGKRGNANDPSQDVVDYNWGAQADQGTTEVYIIDVIAGHCGSAPSPTWSDVTDITYNSGTTGRWISRGRF